MHIKEIQNIVQGEDATETEQRRLAEQERQRGILALPRKERLAHQAIERQVAVELSSVHRKIQQARKERRRRVRSARRNNR